MREQVGCCCRAAGTGAAKKIPSTFRGGLHVAGHHQRHDDFTNSDVLGCLHLLVTGMRATYGFAGDASLARTDRRCC